MGVKPHITLLFLASVFTVLFFISFLFYAFAPEDKEWSVLGLEISFPTPNDYYNKPDQYADISQIIKDNVVTSHALDETEILDTALTVVVADTLRANADSLKQSTRRLEFPKGRRNLLFPVFKAMDEAHEKAEVVRIVHYGDSQIEGDRITSFLRNKFQGKFGGMGIGLAPARQVYDFKYSMIHEASVNWNRYTLYGKPDTLVKHKRYGVLASFNTFTKQPVDTSSIDTTTKKAWISMEKSPYSYSNTKKFAQCRLFYGHNDHPFSLKMIVNEEVVDSGIYEPSDGLKEIKWRFKEPSDNVRLEFEGLYSPEIYALALDGNSGIALDNVAMRGCAGLVFTKMDPELFKTMVDQLSIKLMVLQFGGNIVPNIRKSYNFYERWFFAQLDYIKTHAPELQVIVIGVADMSQKKGTRYESYPNIELVRDAMKKASFRAGAAYWDMYEAMGGKNSMPSWVFAQPPLAGSDFVHFNPKGAKIIANMFYNALISEYNRYKRMQ